MTVQTSALASIPLRLYRIDAVALLLEQGETDAANALFASELTLERLPIGATCLRAVLVSPPELEGALDRGDTSMAASIRRALERALPRGYLLLAMEVTSRESASQPRLRARAAA
ncbi:MAG: hypothetical protein ACXVY8_10520 [Gaiellaceae bacterium]